MPDRTVRCAREPGFRRAGAMALLCLLWGCSSYADLDPLADEVLLARARESYESRSFSDSARLAEAFLERSISPEETEEALYLAGRSHLEQENRKQAFRHFENLMQDYPASGFLPDIERDVYDLGSHYLAGKPGRIFKDLFSGRPFGVEILRQFVATYPVSEWADDSLFKTADYYFGREEYDFAADKYDALVQRFRGSEWYDLSFYRIGLSRLRYTRGPGYDPTLLKKARRDFIRYLSMVPDGAHRSQAEEGLQRTEEMLAESELGVARFYFFREQKRGARVHLANVVLLYPLTHAAADAQELLASNGWDLSLNTVNAVESPGQDDR